MIFIFKFHLDLFQWSFQEVYVIDGIKRQLHQQVQTAFDQISRLQEAKQQLIRVKTSIHFFESEIFKSI